MWVGSGIFVALDVLGAVGLIACFFTWGGGNSMSISGVIFLDDLSQFCLR